MIGAGFGQALVLVTWARALYHIGLEAASGRAPQVTRRVDRTSPPVAAAAPARRTSAPIHRCHARGCFVRCKPEFLMCARHWHMVPAELQRAVWAHYRVGQCDDKKPSREWLAAADAAIAAVHQLEQEAAAKRAVTPSAGEKPPAVPKRERARDQHQLELVDVVPW